MSKSSVRCLSSHDVIRWQRHNAGNDTARPLDKGIKLAANYLAAKSHDKLIKLVLSTTDIISGCHYQRLLVKKRQTNLSVRRYLSFRIYVD